MSRRASKGLRGAWAWFDDRAGISHLLRPVLRHPVPPGIGWWYVLGSATLIAFVVQAVTGMILATVYIPSTAHAYDSLTYIDEEMTLGRVLRGMHYFGSSAMVVLMLAHMARVFVMASYKFPREMNWLAGVGLFVVTIMLAFTGQLLRWDLDGVGSLEVAVQMVGQVPLVGGWLAHLLLGGETISGLTLSRLFALHVFLLPLFLFLLLGLHLYLVMRHGISEPTVAGQPVDPETYRQTYSDLLERRGRRFWPDIAWRDVVTGTVIVLAIVGLAAVFGPRPLGEPPDPTVVIAEPRPDWYFVWYFAVQTAVPPVVEKYLIVVLPIAIVLGLVLVPLLGNKGERSPRRRPWAAAVVFGSVLAMVSLTVAGFAAPWTPRFDATMPEEIVAAREGAELRGALAFEERRCLACHAVKGHGGRYGPDLSDAGERLTGPFIKTRIIRGFGDMPAYGDILTPAQVDDLTAFLQSLED